MPPRKSRTFCRVVFGASKTGRDEFYESLIQCINRQSVVIPGAEGTRIGTVIELRMHQKCKLRIMTE